MRANPKDYLATRAASGSRWPIAGNVSFGHQINLRWLAPRFRPLVAPRSRAAIRMN